MDKVDFFALLAFTAYADGVLADSEKKRLWEAGQRLGLSNDDIKEAFRRVAAPDYAVPEPASPDEAEKILEEVVPLVLEDEKATAAKLVFALCMKWRVDPKIVTRCLRRKYDMPDE